MKFLLIFFLATGLKKQMGKEARLYKTEDLPTFNY